MCRAEDEAARQADISARAGRAGMEAEAARREKAAQQAEERRQADEAVAARRSGLRKTAASDAMSLAHGDAAAVARENYDGGAEESEESRQAVAAKKRASRLRSLEKSIAEKHAERESLLDEEEAAETGVARPRPEKTIGGGGGGGGGEALGDLLASERRRGRAAAAEAELSAAVGREEGEGEWRAERKASFVWVSKPLLDEHTIALPRQARDKTYGGNAEKREAYFAGARADRSVLRRSDGALRGGGGGALPELSGGEEEK